MKRGITILLAVLLLTIFITPLQNLNAMELNQLYTPNCIRLQQDTKVYRIPKDKVRDYCTLEKGSYVHIGPTQNINGVSYTKVMYMEKDKKNSNQWYRVLCKRDYGSQVTYIKSDSYNRKQKQYSLPTYDTNCLRYVINKN